MYKLSLLGALLALAPLVAQAGPGSYLNLGAGVSRLDPAIDSEGLVLADDGEAQGWRLALGRRLSPRTSVEVFYSDLGSADFGADGQIDYSVAGLNGQWRVGSAGRAMGKLSLYLSAGLGYLQTDVNGALAVSRDSDVLVLGGAGLEWPLGRHSALRAGVEAYDSDAALATLSVVVGGHRHGDRRVRHGGDSRADQAREEPMAARGDGHTGGRGEHSGRLGERATAGEVATSGARNKAGVFAAGAGVTVASVVDDTADATLALDVISFNRDSSFVTEAGEAVLDQLIETLLSFAQMRVEIQGHADPAETATNPHALSEQRAQRVGNYLFENGVDPSRLQLVSYGASQPAADAGSALNRRVQFRILELD